MLKQVKTNKRVIYRYDLCVPDESVEELFKFSTPYRALFVYLVFSKGFEFYEALEFVNFRREHDCLIDWANDSVPDAINWHEVDRLALDDSKTFVNGVRYL